jgi:phosphoglycerate dehydrogenase-like enzyme
LDVFEREPLPPESPLWSLPGVTICPHISADMPGTRQRSMALFTDNLRRFLDGRSLLNVVDLDRGY